MASDDDDPQKSMSEEISDLETKVDTLQEALAMAVQGISDSYMERTRELESDVAELQDENQQMKEKLAGFGMYNDDEEYATMTIADYDPDTWSGPLPTSIIPSLGQDLHPIKINHIPELPNNIRRIDKATVAAAAMLEVNGFNSVIYTNKDQMGSFIQSHFSFSDNIRPNITDLICNRIYDEMGHRSDDITDDYWYAYVDLTNPVDRVILYGKAAAYHGFDHDAPHNLIAKDGDYPLSDIVVEITGPVCHKLGAEIDADRVAYELYNCLSNMDDQKLNTADDLDIDAVCDSIKDQI